ncbi:TlpA disulfide reductase family protein [Corynebacterium macginleyi]|uniref:TlpA disulfide reductase family protein n=1 Tax=Corynebacterium macginleyi TaxID=38290 RepID=UPI002D80497B|nr:TlpA disulfide reductase family protein [Corynebacterium macginleyi]
MLSASIAGGASVLAACTGDGDAKNAVANNGRNEIYAPDGELDHFIRPDDREEPLDFSGDSLMDEEKKIYLSDFAGQMVVINAWGQWCAPCRTEIDDLQEVHEDMQSKKLGTVLGINVRDYNPQIARDFLKDNGITYPSIYDPPFKTAASLGGIPASVIPSTVILDSRHRQAAVFIRPIEAADLQDVIQKIAAE